MRRPVAIIFTCLLVAGIPIATASAQKADPNQINKLRQQSSIVKQGMDQVEQLKAQRKQAIAQLPYLKQRAHDAMMLSQRAQQDYQTTQTKFQEVSDKLNHVTLRYIQTVQSMSWAQAGLEGQIPELSQMANSSNIHDTVLVFSQAQTIMNNMQGQLDNMRSLAVTANKQRQYAETSRNNATATQLAASQAISQQTQLTAALHDSQKALQSNVASDQKELARTFNKLLDSGADLPGVDVAALGLPGAQRIVQLALVEYHKGVHETPDGSNQSPDIARYLTATAGAVTGAAWCAYFVSYIARRAGMPIGDGGQGMGYVGSVNDWAQSVNRYFSSSDTRFHPQGGDVIMWSPNHIGIVIANHGGTLTTVEGNASNRVNKLTRSATSATGYLRLWGSPLNGAKGGSGGSGGVDLGAIN